MSSILPEALKTVRRLSIQQAADFLQVSTKTLRRWEKQGYLIPERTVGNQRRYSLIQLQEFNPKANKHLKPISPIPSQVYSLPPIASFSPLQTPDIVPAHIQVKTGFPKKILIPSLITALFIFAGITYSYFKAKPELFTLDQIENITPVYDQVLAAETFFDDLLFQVNIPSSFTKDVTIEGNLTAPNIIYQILAGEGVTVSPGQTPTISMDGVTSLQSRTGDLALVAGTGVTIDGLTITNADRGSTQKIFSKIKVSGQSDIDAGSNTDTLEFVAGSNISLNTDSGNKKLTINSSATSGTNYWQLNSGALAPSDTANDLLIGGSATASATFQVQSLTGNIISDGSLTLSNLASGVVFSNSGSFSSETYLSVTRGGLGGDVSAAGAGELLYSTGATAYDNLAAGTADYILKSNGAATPSWVDPATLGLGNYWQQALGVLSPVDITSDIAIGGTATGSALFKVEGTTGNTDVAGTFTSGTGNAFAIDASGQVTAGTWQGTAVANVYGGTGQDSSGWTGVPYVSAGGWAVDTNYLAIARGGTNSNATPTAGGVAYGDATGYQFTSVGSAGQLLQSNAAGAPTWVSASAVNFWQTALGALSPLDITNDLLIGGTATGSALFKVEGTTGNTDVAGTFTSGTGNAFTIDASGQVTAGTWQGTAVANVYGGTGQDSSGWTGVPYVSGGGWAVDTNYLAIGRGGTNSNATPTAGGVAYGDATGYQFTSVGSAGQLLQSNAAGAPTWVSASAVNFWQTALGALSPLDITNDLLIGGTATGSALFKVEGTTGNTDVAGTFTSGTGNAFTIDASGQVTAGTWQGTAVANVYGGTGQDSSGWTGVPYVSGGGWAVDTNYLAIGRGGTNSNATPTAGGVAYGDATGYQFTSVGSAGQLLQSNAAGAPTWVSASAVNFWQTALGALSPLDITNDLLIGGTATGSALFKVEGTTGNTDVAGTFTSGTGNAFTIDASGQVTAGTWQGTAVANVYGGTGQDSSGWTGVPYVSGGGWAVDTNYLAIARGGTNSNATPTAGGVAYGDATGYQFTSVGSAGQLLQSNAAGAPTWVSASAVNFWQTALGALSPLDITNDLLIGGTATGSALFKVEGTTGNTDVAGTFTSGTGNAFAIDASGQVTAGTWQGTAVANVYGGTGQDSSGWTGVPYVSAGGWAVDTNYLAIARGGTNSNATPTAGGVAYGDATGYQFTSVGSAGQLLQSNAAGAPTWVSASAVNFWQTALGALSPLDITNDLLIGGTATGSALFKVEGTTGNTDVAGTFTSGTGNAFAIDASGQVTAGTWQGTAVANVYGGTGQDSSGWTGVPYVSAGGWAVDTNYLAIARGGTNSNATPTAGGVAYGDATGYQFTSVGSAGQLLQSNAAGAPTWVSASAVNFWQTALGALSPLDITNDLLIGGTATGSALFKVEGTTGNTDVAGTFTSGTGNAFAIDASGQVTAGTWQGTAVANVYGGTGQDSSGWTGVPYVSAGGWAVDTNYLAIARGGTNSNATPTAGGVAYGDATGYQFTSVGSAGQLLQSNAAGAPTWVSASAVNFWQTALGALSPLDITNDLLIGGTATGSALFKVEGTTGNTDVAGTFTSGTGNAFAIDASGQVTAGTWQGTAVANVYGGTGQDSSGWTGVPYVSAGGWAVDTNYLAIARGGTNSNATPTAGGVAYGDATGYQFTSVGSAGQLLQSNAAGAPTWVSASAVNFWQTALGALSPLDITNDLLIGGTATGSALFKVEGTTGNTDVAGTFTSGTGNAFAIDASGQVTAGTWQGTAVANVYGGTGQDSSGWTGVPYVSAGGWAVDTNYLAIARGGTNSNATPTAGGVAYGDATGYQFTSVGSAGQLLQSNAAGAPTWVSASAVNFWQTALGALSPLDITNDLLIGGTATGSALFKVEGTTGNTDVAGTFTSGTGNAFAIDASGQVTAGTWQGTAVANVYGGTGQDSSGWTGVPYVSAGGWAVDTNYLAIARGGTNSNATPTAGGVAYGDATGYQFTSVGSAGQLLQSNAAGAPTWVSASAVNFWQTALGALSPLDITNDLLIGGTATGSALFKVEGTTGNTDVAGTFTSGTGNAFAIDASGQVTAGTWQGTAVANVYGGTGQDSSGWTGVPYVSAGGWAVDTNYLAIARGGTNSNATPTAGGVAYGDATGYQFTSVGSAGQLLQSNAAGAPTWVSASAVNFWQTALGALSPLDITNDLLIGGTATGSALFKVEGTTGNTDVAGTFTSGTGNAFAIDASGQVTAGTWQGTAVANVYGGTGQDSSGWTGVPYVSAGGWAVDTNYLAIARGGTNSNATPTAGGVAYGDATGYQFTSVGSAGQLLQSNAAGAPTWVSASAVNFWQTALGVISPLEITNDLAIGGTATVSAKFIVEGLTGNLITRGSASVSGTLTLANSSAYTAGIKSSDSTTGSYTLTLPTAQGAASQIPYTTDANGTLGWTSLSAAGTNYWQLVNSDTGIAPLNANIQDLFIGGTATNSALFHVEGLTGNATISGNLSVANSKSFTFGGETFTDLTGNGMALSSSSLAVDLLDATDSAGLTNSRSGMEFGDYFKQ